MTRVIIKVVYYFVFTIVGARCQGVWLFHIAGLDNARIASWSVSFVYPRFFLHKRVLETFKRV